MAVPSISAVVSVATPVAGRTFCAWPNDHAKKAQGGQEI